MQTDFAVPIIPATFFCPICREDTPIGTSYELDCTHRVCAQCLSGYISSKVDAAEVDEARLVCPCEACTVPIPLETARECCSSATFRKLADFRTDRFVDAATRAGALRRCPGARCDYPFEPAGPGPQDFHCPKCAERFCLACPANAGQDGPAHPGRTCAEQLEEQAFL